MTRWLDTDRGSPVLLEQVAGPPTEHSDSTVLLLHGMGDSPSIWRSMTQAMSDSPSLTGLAVWTAALPWRAGAAPEWTHRTDPANWMADALGAIAECAGGAQIVVAHSYSATAVLDLLTGESARGGHSAQQWGIDGLVLVAPFFRASPEDFDWNITTQLASQFVDTVQEGIRVGAGHRGEDWVRQAMATRVCEMIGPYGWLRFFDLYLRTPWLHLDLLEIPVVIVCGAADQIAPPTDSGALSRQLAASSLHVFEDCGHFPMAEQPGRLVGLLEDLLTSVNQPSHAPVPFVRRSDPKTEALQRRLRR